MKFGLNLLEKFSLFNYIHAGRILSSGTFPIGDFFVLFDVRVIFLIDSLVIFEKREFAI